MPRGAKAKGLQPKVEIPQEIPDMGMSSVIQTVEESVDEDSQAVKVVKIVCSIFVDRKVL